MLFAPSAPAAASFATAWRFVSRRNDVFDGEVISVDTSNSASPGTLFGSATVIVRVRGCSLRKKGIGVASTDRILRSGNFPLTLRSEEHTSELQSLAYLVCRLLL